MSFGQRRRDNGTFEGLATNGWGDSGDVGGEISWIPKSGGDDAAEEGHSRKARKGKKGGMFKLERGEEVEKEERYANMKENDRKGRSRRRTGVRSGSKNAFRRR
jgi:ribosome biogenesis protein ENP2